jgi:transposase
MKIALTPEEVKELRLYRRNSTDASYIKVTGILMLHKGFSVSEVSDSLGIDSSTLYRYCQTCKHRGISALLANNSKGYWGLLSGIQISELRMDLKRQVYTVAKSVSIWIRKRFDPAGSCRFVEPYRLHLQENQRNPL